VREGEYGPLVQGALAWLECKTWAEYPAGDHTLFVGEVERGELGADEPGLFYRRSSYRAAE
jgi:flavin reductase (DIM6/NTAB) family NADH-FMN oxidoreductase RutF